VKGCRPLENREYREALNVIPEGAIRPDDILQYTIEFENEGDGIAFGVFVEDILDPSLDDSTLILSDGGSYDPVTRKLTWDLGAVDPHAGRTLQVTVATIGDLQPGTRIYNYATVYFPSVPEVTRTNGELCEPSAFGGCRRSVLGA
jgi:uncharacterized repeat protein (TIGR01451 family)